MFTRGTIIYLQLTHQVEERILHPAVIVDTGDATWTAQLKKDVVQPPEPGGGILVYYERHQRFMQQVGRIVAHSENPPSSAEEPTDMPHDWADMPTDWGGTASRGEGAHETPPTAPSFLVDTEIYQGPLFTFEATGDPISAETRECYRASTLFSNLTAVIDGESGYLVLDVSGTGFSVLSRRGHTQGSIVQAELVWDGTTYAGEVCMKCLRKLRDGTFRCGLHAVEERGRGDNLRGGLQTINAAVQREMLRRRSRVC